MLRRFQLPLILLLILVVQMIWAHYHSAPVSIPAPPPVAQDQPQPDNGPIVASEAACGQNLFQGAAPTMSTKMESGLTLVCYQGYASASSPITRTPMWSAEHLTAARVRTARATERTSAFYPEPSLATDTRGELSDYRRSGFDRGHLSPSGDMPGHEEQRQSFSLANIAPQNSDLNRGPWADLESRMRDYAQRNGELWVVTGVLFEGAAINTTPDGRVMVPTSFWKAVAVPGQGAMVFVAPNNDSGTIDKLSLADFTRRTGISPFPRMAQAGELEME
jgi:endonuclease G